jgi:hypothetical protein
MSGARRVSSPSGAPRWTDCYLGGNCTRLIMRLLALMEVQLWCNASSPPSSSQPAGKPLLAGRPAAFRKVQSWTTAVPQPGLDGCAAAAQSVSHRRADWASSGQAGRGWQLVVLSIDRCPPGSRARRSWRVCSMCDVPARFGAPNLLAVTSWLDAWVRPGHGQSVTVRADLWQVCILVASFGRGR